MVRDTSARPSGGLPEVPAKMTSSILPPRRDFAPCSPITQASASTTLDLPEPLGPTMQVIPGSSCRGVADEHDLNPRSVRLLRYTGAPLGVRRRRGRPVIVSVVGAERRWNDGLCQDTAVGKVSGESLPVATPDPRKPALRHIGRFDGSAYAGCMVTGSPRNRPNGRVATPPCARGVGQPSV